MKGVLYFGIQLRDQKALVKWSKDIVGNVFQRIATLEDMVRMKEAQLEINSTDASRKELAYVEEELKKHYQLEEEFRKQKAGMTWFTKGMGTLSSSICMSTEEGKN